jgi:ATP-dependent Lon protease
VRLTRPSPLQPSQPFLLSLQGISRFQFADSHHGAVSLKDIRGELRRFPIIYPPEDHKQPPSPETTRVFKEAAITLLNRLNIDAGDSSVKKEAWSKLSELIEEVGEDKACWYADVMVGAVNGEYVEKLGEFTY